MLYTLAWQQRHKFGFFLADGPLHQKIVIGLFIDYLAIKTVISLVNQLLSLADQPLLTTGECVTNRALLVDISAADTQCTSLLLQPYCSEAVSQLSKCEQLAFTSSFPPPDHRYKYYQSVYRFLFQIRLVV